MQRATFPNESSCSYNIGWAKNRTMKFVISQQNVDQKPSNLVHCWQSVGRNVSEYFCWKLLKCVAEVHGPNYKKILRLSYDDMFIFFSRRMEAGARYIRRSRVVVLFYM